ncbi:hypothetical protein D5086_025893 [Populus alba]|uniref:Uncharacterized protein n=1 Tax=Populus alba TaxID=43335 RepID=A0ACC4B179_POPAL
MLRTVDFRSCKGAEELQEKLKLLMELYKQMTAEKATITKWKITPNSSESGLGLKPQEQLQETADQSQPGQVFAKPSEKQQAEHGHTIPIIDKAKVFSIQGGARTSIITTLVNATHVSKLLERTKKLDILTIKFPCVEEEKHGIEAPFGFGTVTLRTRDRGLAVSGQQFIWVVKKNKEDDKED